MDATCGCYEGCKCGGWKQLVGRILLALPFLVTGWMEITNFSTTVGFVASAGFPAPEFMTILAIIFEFGGAVLLTFGVHARTASLALIVFVVTVTLSYHLNWSDPIQQVMFLKNFGLIGGLLYVFAYGAGRMSLKQWDKYCWGGRWCPDCRVAKPTAY